VERGRLKPSDELSIAHIRYRLNGAPTKEAALASNPESVVSLSWDGKPGRSSN
jgi:hypothetical protein